jgi:homoserine acetyltransferase
MDLFDMTHSALTALNLVPSSSLSSNTPQSSSPTTAQTLTPHRSPPYLTDLAKGLAPLAHTPTLVLGVQSDILFPVEQQREVADALRMAGNTNVSYYELGGVWGHDTFLFVFRSL